MNIIWVVSLFGGLATLTGSILKETRWSPTVNTRITLGVSMVMGIIATIASGTTNWADAGVVVTSVMGASQGYFTLISQPLNLDQKIADAVPSPLRPIVDYCLNQAAIKAARSTASGDQPTSTPSSGG